MRLRPGLVAIAVVLILAAGGVGLWFSPWVKFSSVQVVGNHHQTTAEIVAAAALVRGTRLTDISSAQVAARVQSLTWVESARVTHELPSRIRIVVRERVPAVVVQGQGHSYLVDRDGAVLQEASGGYPLVTGLALGVVIPGQRLGLAAYGNAVAVLNSLSPELKANLASVDAPAANLISVILSDHTRIIYGDAANLADKNYAVAALLASGGHYQSVDVRAPSHPATTPR